MLSKCIEPLKLLRFDLLSFFFRFCFCYSDAIADYVRAHYCISLLPFVLSFTMLIALVFFYDDITKGRHMAVFYCYTVIMVRSITAWKYTIPDIAKPPCCSTALILLSKDTISNLNTVRRFFLYLHVCHVEGHLRIIFIHDVHTSHLQLLQPKIFKYHLWAKINLFLLVTTISIIFN